MRFVSFALMAMATMLAGLPADAQAVEGRQGHHDRNGARAPIAEHAARHAARADSAMFALADGRSAEVTTYADGGVSVKVGDRVLSGDEAMAFLTRNGVRIVVQDGGRIVQGPKPVEVAKFQTNEGKKVTVTTYDDASMIVSTSEDILTGAPAMRYLSQSGIALRTTDTGHITAADVTGGARVVTAPLPASKASSDAKPVEVATFMTGDKKKVTVTTYDDASVIVSTSTEMLTDTPAMTYLSQSGISLQAAVDGHITSVDVNRGSKVLVAPLAAARAGTSDVLPAETAKFMTEDKQVVDLTTYEDGSMRIDFADGSMTGEEATAFLGQHSIDVNVAGNGHVSWTKVDNGSKVLIPPLSAALASYTADKAEQAAAAGKDAVQKTEADEKSAQSSEASSSRSTAASWTPTVVLPANVAIGSSTQVHQAQVDAQGSVSGDPGINEQSISR